MPETKGKRRTPPPTPDRDAGPPTALVNLLYQLLETELGGAQVYRTALRAAVRPDLLPRRRRRPVGDGGGADRHRVDPGFGELHRHHLLHAGSE